MRSAADVWEKVKKLMEGGMTAVAIDTWFGDVEAVALEDTRLVLCVPTDFKLGIIRTRFQAGIEAALKELFSFDVDVALLLPEEREALLSALDGIIRRESEDRLRSYRTALPHL